jgi:hypothetical protein
MPIRAVANSTGNDYEAAIQVRFIWRSPLSSCQTTVDGPETRKWAGRLPAPPKFLDGLYRPQVPGCIVDVSSQVHRRNCYALALNKPCKHRKRRFFRCRILQVPTKILRTNANRHCLPCQKHFQKRVADIPRTRWTHLFLGRTRSRTSAGACRPLLAAHWRLVQPRT